MGKVHPIDLHVGKRLRQRRLSTGINRIGLAKAAGISLQQLHKYERGVDRIASSRLFRFAELLGVSVEFFFQELPESRQIKASPSTSTIGFGLVAVSSANLVPNPPDFIVCLGYKGYLIKEYFQNYFLHEADVTFHIGRGEVTLLRQDAEPWNVTLIDTGIDTQIGGRIKRVLHHLAGDDAFCLTYGDGVGDVDIGAVIDQHCKSGMLATVTATQPPGRFGALRYEGQRVLGFQEKPQGDGGWINGGFFVCSPKVGDFIEGDQTVWEREPMERLAALGKLGVYFHKGFWQPMDTLRDRRHLEDLWSSGKAPWKVWS